MVQAQGFEQPVYISGRSWQDQAACRDVDTEVFYPADGERCTRKARREATAKAICAVCPVRNLCLNWALSIGEANGVWGGLTAEERNRMASAGLPMAS